MGHRDLWNSHPKTEQGGRKCRISGNTHALIRKYGLNIDRQSFRENAEMLGWRKYH